MLLGSISASLNSSLPYEMEDPPPEKVSGCVVRCYTRLKAAPMFDVSNITGDTAGRQEERLMFLGCCGLRLLILVSHANAETALEACRPAGYGEVLDNNDPSITIANPVQNTLGAMVGKTAVSPACSVDMASRCEVQRPSYF